MKISKFGQKLKSSIRKHYVRKKDFEALSKEIKRLKKQLAKLENCCEALKSEPQEVEIKSAKTAQEPVKSMAGPGEDAVQDKLTSIKGIGPVLEKKLHDLGITRFSQIAGWNAADIEKVSEHLSFKGRIQREKWIEQATNLAS